MDAVIVNRDRLTSTQKIVEWLLARHHRVILRDNNSTYPPLLAWYDTLPGSVELVRFAEQDNDPRPVEWARHQTTGDVFCLTDSDVVPTDTCPDDLLDVLAEGLNLYPWVRKAGVGLKTDDFPDTATHRARHIRTEAALLRGPHLGPFLLASVDTTLAVWPRARPATLECGPALRTQEPYMARHLPWYLDLQNLPEDEAWYVSRTCLPLHSLSPRLPG